MSVMVSFSLIVISETNLVISSIFSTNDHDKETFGMKKRDGNEVRHVKTVSRIFTPRNDKSLPSKLTKIRASKNKISVPCRRRRRPSFAIICNHFYN